VLTSAIVPPLTKRIKPPPARLQRSVLADQPLGLASRSGRGRLGTPRGGRATLAVEWFNRVQSQYRPPGSPHVGALALAGVAAGYWGMRRQVSSASRVIGMRDSPPVSVFVGGAIGPTVSVTTPLARLELFGWGVRLSASARWLRFFPLSVPTWEARYDELAVVRRVTGIGTGGLRLAVADSADAVVFWTSQWPEILDRLEAAGASVDRLPVRVKQAGGVYRTWRGSTS
jgi:hypothetical protein